MKTYLDVNFLVSLYLDRDPGTIDARLGNTATEDSSLVVTRLVVMEVINALERTVYVSETGGPLRISREIVAASQARFREDLELGCYEECPIELTRISRRFEELALRHTARHGFRTYDLLHVASAIALGCGRFWSFDGKALSLAQLEGLETE